MFATVFRSLLPFSKNLSQYRIAILTACLGTALSYTAFSVIQYYEAQKVTAQFEASVADKSVSLERSLMAIEKVLSSTKHLFEVKPSLSQSEFAQILDKDFLAHTGLKGLMWSPKIEATQVDAYVESVRRAGVFDFRIDQSNKGDCHSEHLMELFPVRYAEPTYRMGDKIGQDLFSDCELRESMLRAAEGNGMLAHTYISDEQQTGLILLYPLFNGEQLAGFISGIVELQDMIDNLFADLSDQHSMTLHRDSQKQTLLYQSFLWEQCQPNCDDNYSLVRQASVPFAHQLWHGTFYRHSEAGLQSNYAYFAALLIMALTVALGCHLVASVHRIRWADQLVKEKTESLQYQASHCQLTRLLNKSSLETMLKELLSEQPNQPFKAFTVLFIDLDHFKKINDTQGHLLGDEVLVSISDRLIANSRQDDSLFRFGGDEFVIVLRGIESRAVIERLAQRYLKEIQKPIELNNESLKVDASIGAYMIHHNNYSTDAILRNADIAMYEAKQNGRGQVIFFNHQMFNKVILEHRLEDSLQQAIEKNQLFLNYQPIVNSHQKIIGFEALVRWRHPENGLIMPDKFVPLAEKNGSINQLGNWVLEHSIYQIAKWQHLYGSDACPYISVNLSSLQLKDSTLVENIKRLLTTHRVAANKLRLELTESAFIEDQGLVKRQLNQLKEAGIQVYLDDFGTGYSSLSHLQYFPIDVIKIDRSFVQGLEKGNQGSKSLIVAVINLAEALNISVVAEGVEDQFCFDWLQSKGCQQFQGYYFARPLSSEQAPNYIDNNLKGMNSKVRLCANSDVIRL